MLTVSAIGSGGRIRTCDLQDMSLTSYHCSTPRSLLRPYTRTENGKVQPKEKRIEKRR